MMSRQHWADDMYYADELQPLGLTPDVGTGAFFEPDALLAFVEKNPEFRIISGDPGHLYNRYVPGSSWYYLSRNTADSNLSETLPRRFPR